MTSLTLLEPFFFLFSGFVVFLSSSRLIICTTGTPKLHAFIRWFTITSTDYVVMIL